VQEHQEEVVQVHLEVQKELVQQERRQPPLFQEVVQLGVQKVLAQAVREAELQEQRPQLQGLLHRPQ